MINEDVTALKPYSFNDNFEGIRYEKKCQHRNSLLEQKLSIIKKEESKTKT
jgi:hypothetical protein